MSEQIQRRLAEVMAMIPFPVSGCWFVHGAETAYYYDENSGCHATPLTILGGLRLELLSGKGLEPALLEGIGLKDETVFCHHGVVLRKTHMQTRTVPWLHSVRLPGRGHQRNGHNAAKRAESLSGSMRQFVTPQVWKQVKHAAKQHGCRDRTRWTLQPLILIAAIMTWCAGETDADRFVLSRAFYVQIHAPKRQRPGKTFSGFCEAMLRLPMPVWWAFCDAVRSRVFHLLADRMTTEGWLPLGCDGSRIEMSAHRGVGTELGEVQKGQIGTDAVGDRLGQLDHWGPLVLAFGDIQDGGTSLPDRSVGDAPQAVLQSVLLVCDAGYVGYDLFGRLLKQQCSFLIRLSSQAQLYSLEMVKVEGFTEGEFWYWTDDAESKSQPALHVRVIRVAAKKRHNDVWLVTNVLDPKRLPAGLAARFYRMRWESECFFRTYKRVVKDVRLVSRTAPMVVREAEVSLLACQLLLGQGALALKVGGKRAGRDELKCSAGGSAPGGPPRARRGSQAGAAAKFCQAVATDRTRSPGANRPQDETTTTAAEEARGSPAAAVEGTQCRAKAQIEALNLKEAAA